MQRHLQYAVVAALAGATLRPSIASAQVEFTPALGMDFPVGGWSQVSDWGTGFRPERRHLATHLFTTRLDGTSFAALLERIRGLEKSGANRFARCDEPTPTCKRARPSSGTRCR